MSSKACLENVVDVRGTTRYSGAKEYAIFWERIGNSGIILRCANSAEEAARACWSFDFVRHTVVEIKGEAVQFGRMG